MRSGVRNHRFCFGDLASLLICIYLQYNVNKLYHLLFISYPNCWWSMAKLYATLFSTNQFSTDPTLVFRFAWLYISVLRSQSWIRIRSFWPEPEPDPEIGNHVGIRLWFTDEEFFEVFRKKSVLKRLIKYRVN